MKFKILFFLTFLLFVCFNVLGQSIIRGTVKDASGVLFGANVFLKNVQKGGQTNEQGRYEIKCSEGVYIVVVSFVGFKTVTKKVSVKNNEVVVLDFFLEEDTYQLDNIIISSKTKAEKLREESYAVEVVESKLFKNLSVNANEILNKVSGVNIRQSGGFGEDSVLSLNGLSGSQVRVFIDGIPMEYFGSSLSLNNFPANLIEQIEVYKGVVPIHLSSDALGGAINITTNKSQKSFLDISYSYGSFNTHVASINAQYRSKSSGFTTRLKSFYNHSDNNYKVDVNLLDPDTGRFDDFTTKVEHFHDAYNSKMAWFEAGFTNVNFADEFMIGIMYSDNYNETQQAETAIGDSANPYGEVFTEEHNIISTLNFSKNKFLTENLSLKSYFVNVISESHAQNTSDYDYDWLTNKTLGDDGTGENGERKTDLTLDSNNILGNISLGYTLSETSNIALNYNINFFGLSGEDEFNSQNNTAFSNPISFDKQVLASSFTQSFFNNKFRNTGFTKYYYYSQNSTDTNFFGDESTEVSSKFNHLGFGIASTYFLNDFQFKFSFENAIRFPDVIEIYGDGDGYAANPFIEPEESYNYNLGTIYTKKFNENSLTLSTNGFIRDSKDFIYGRPEGTVIVHENLEDVLTKGVDFSANLNINKKINFNVAATYTNQVNNEKFLEGGDLNSLYKIRIPNDPYLYGNISLSYIKQNLFSKDDNFSVTVNENYVHKFFYRWSNLGNLENKNIVPTQLTTDFELVYSFKNQKHNASFGVLNVFNEKTYDNLYQQNPRRSFNFKLRYFIN